LMQCVGSGLRVAWSDERLEMAKNGGPSVGHGKLSA
jgi:hypothetical protein